MNFSDRLGIILQRTVWQRRVGSWEHEASPGLERVIDAVVDAASVGDSDRVVDLGCGSGQVALRIAGSASSVLGVDISARMVERMLDRARAEGLANVSGRVSPLETLSLPPGSASVIVSNYVLHHLGDGGKARVVKLCFDWLEPGGRLVIGDMMFGRGATSSDRQVIAGKVKLLASKGVGGYWRIAKNAFRYLFRVQEKPVSRERWLAMLADAGFEAIGSRAVVSEASVVFGRKPQAGGTAAPGH